MSTMARGTICAYYFNIYMYYDMTLYIWASHLWPVNKPLNFVITYVYGVYLFWIWLEIWRVCIAFQVLSN